MTSSPTEVSIGFDSEEYSVVENGPYGGGSVLVCVILEFPVAAQPIEFTVYSLSQTAQGKCSLSDA